MDLMDMGSRMGMRFRGEAPPRAGAVWLRRAGWSSWVLIGALPLRWRFGE